MDGERRRRTAEFQTTRERVSIEALDDFLVLQPEVNRREAEHKAEIERIRAEARQEALALAAEAEAADSDCVVYYLRFADRVKIGYTVDITRRCTEIPHDELLATEPGGRVVEAMRHRQFAGYRLIGEWFTMAPELMGHIDQVRGRTPELRRVEREREANAAHRERMRDAEAKRQDVGQRLFPSLHEEPTTMDHMALLTRAIGID